MEHSLCWRQLIPWRSLWYIALLCEFAPDFLDDIQLR